MIRQHPALGFEEDACGHIGRDQRTVPLAGQVQASRRPRIDRDIKPEVGEESLDAIGVLGAYALDGNELALRLAAILVVGKGNADDAREFELAAINAAIMCTCLLTILTHW